MTNLLTLATQIEQATEDQQISMLVAVAEHMWGCGAAPQGTDPDLWVQRWNRFNLMLAAKAYESAAMMLVPPGLHWCCQTDRDGAHVSVGKADWDARGTFYTDCHHGDAKTLALALAAACCRAVAQMREG